MSKVVKLEDALSRVRDGSTIMIGGFLGVGTPLKCIEKLCEMQVKDLTLISIVASNPTGNFDLAPLFKNGQIKKFITSHVGTSPEAVEELKNGRLEVEMYPMGTWIEKIRAGGGGLGGVLTPIGLGTFVEEGKQTLTVNGKQYLLELPLRAEIAIIKGYQADHLGNVRYRGVSRNSNPVLATAADYVIAEVNEIVNVGDLDPDLIGTPGIFVDAVVQGNSLDEHRQVYHNRWVSTGQI